MRKSIIFILLLIIFSACGERHDSVLSKRLMKDILYDYHLAQALIETHYYNDTLMARACLQAVFDKHDITEAQFDSSMVYYNRHPEELKAIYESLKDQYNTFEKDLQAQSGTNDMMVFTEGGDTADIWSKQKMYVLRPNPLQNKESFVILADTSFRHHDQFILQTNVGFARINKSTRDCILTLSLSIMYENGKIVNETHSTSYDGQQRLQLQAVFDSPIKKILGFFYYESTCNDKNMVLVENISLYRIHEAQSDTVATDTTQTSIVPVSQDAPTTTTNIKRVTDTRHPTIKTDTQKVQIRKMPETRTPNKGPRRKLRKQ